jgi:hypothetical protein
MPIDLISAFVGFILTLLVLSYLIGDNPLYRIAIYVFVGVASGYAAVVAWQYVLLPRLIQPLASANPAQLVLVIVPLVLSLSLLTKLSPRIAWLGGFAMALMVGVGAATALSGAVLGTLIPQSRAAMGAFTLPGPLGFLQGVFMLMGTVLTLAYFQFSASRAADGTVKRNAFFEIMAWGGRVFIAVTLGVLFAGVYLSALTALLERLSSLINFVKALLGL